MKTTDPSSRVARDEPRVVPRGVGRRPGALVRTLQALADAPDTDRCLTLLLTALVELTGADSGSLWARDSFDNAFHRLCQVGDGPDGTYAGPFHDAPPPESPPFVASASRLSHLPLVSHGRILGAVVLHNARRGHLTRRAATARALGHQGALLLRAAERAALDRRAGVLDERQLLASEIHDALAQYFAGILLQLGVAQRLATLQPEEAWSLVAQADAMARTAAHEARQSIWTLQPATVEYRDIACTLPQMVAQQTQGSTVETELVVYGTPCLLSAHVGLNLLRIGQEALNNALHHAGAQQICIELSFEPDYVRLCLQDDGQGFDLQTGSFQAGFGLSGMQQRAERIGAILNISSKPGQGTEVVATVPTTAPRDQETAP